MEKSNPPIQNFSERTFKVMEVEGKPEIFASDIHSDEWNDGQEEFGVKKINQLSDTTNQVVGKTNELENVTKKQTSSINELETVTKSQTSSINGLETITKIQIDSINELTKKINQLEAGIEKNKPYIGEYKWMKVGSNMPTGWIKVPMDKGFTLINGSTEGTSKGTIAAHSHKSKHGYFVECKYSDTNTHHVKDTAGTENAYPANKIGPSSDTFTSKYDRTADSEFSNAENFAAGKYAELWEYNPVKYAEMIAL